MTSTTHTLGHPIATGRWEARTADGQAAEARDCRQEPVWRAMEPGPGMVEVHAVDAGRVVLAPLAVETLAAVDPLPASAVAFVGIRIASALGTVGERWDGPLRLTDLGLDAAGHPVLAPSPEPVDEALPDVRAARAPEGTRGRQAALYGLGAALYQLATGTLPSGDPPVPPSERHAGIPPALDAAVLGLLSPRPAARDEAVGQLARLAEPADLKRWLGTGTRFARATLAAGEVKLTTRAPTTRAASRDVRVPAAAAAIEGDILQSLPPSALSHLAGVTELPIDHLREAARDGRMVVLEPLFARSGVTGAAARHQRDLEMPVIEVAGPGLSRLFEVLFFLIVGTAALGGAAVTGSIGVWLVALVAYALGAVSVWGGLRTAAQKREAVAAYTHQERARDAAPAWVADIAARRRSLAQADLPEPIERDVRTALDDLEHSDDTGSVSRGLMAIDGLLARHGNEDERDAAARAEAVARMARQAARETTHR